MGMRLKVQVKRLYSYSSKYAIIKEAYLHSTLCLGNEQLHFDVISSRSINDPPSIRVTFANGVQDDLELTQYKFQERSEGGCNYLGRLRNDRASSVAVTGCLIQPGDSMDVTLISKNNANKMFSVDFFGNTERIENPFKQGGSIDLIRFSDITT